MVHHAPGQKAEADAAIERLSTVPHFSKSIRLAEVYAWRGEIDENCRDRIAGTVTLTELQGQ
jgi:hypothetical protein